jgi:hypothetical protein
VAQPAKLVAAVGVVIGLEVTIVVRLALEERLPLAATWRGACLFVFVGVLAVQVWLLWRLLLIAYRGELVVGPESPTVLADYIAQRDEIEAHRVTGAYYAKAHDRFHEQSERLGADLAKATRWFQVTLLALFVGVGLLTVGALCGRGRGMDNEAPSAPSGSPGSGAPAPSTPAPGAPSPQAPPATNPLTTTPTEGQVMRKSEQGGQVLRDQK